MAWFCNIENYLLLSLMILISIFINVTVAGWLAIKTAEFMWEKIQKL